MAVPLICSYIIVFLLFLGIYIVVRMGYIKYERTDTVRATK